MEDQQLWSSYPSGVAIPIQATENMTWSIKIMTTEFGEHMS